MAWLFRACWKQRRQIATRCFVLVVLICLSALFRVNWYKSTALLMLPTSRKIGGPGSLHELAAVISPGLIGNDNFVSPASFRKVVQSRRISEVIVKRFGLEERYGAKNLEMAQRIFSRRLSFQETGGTNILSIGYSEPSVVRFSAVRRFFGDDVMERERPAATFARDVVTAIIQEFNKVTLALSMTAAERERNFLAKRVAQARESMLESEGRLADYKTKRGTPALRAQAQASMGALTILQQRLMALRWSRNSMKATLGTEHPEILKLDAQIRSTRDQMTELGKSRSDEDPSMTGKATSGFLPLYLLPSIERQFTELVREAAIQTTVYAALVEQYEQAKIAAARDVAMLKILDPPNVPLRKSGPKQALHCILGAFFALIFSLGWALVTQARREGFFDECFVDDPDTAVSPNAKENDGEETIPGFQRKSPNV